jgi:hypothetical protein
MTDSLLDPTPMGPPQAITRGKAVAPPPAPGKFVKPGPVEKVIHYKDELKCNHGGKVDLDPTEERDTEISKDLRVVTDVDLLEKVTIRGCSLNCTKIVDIPVGRARDVELRGGAIPVLSNLKATTDKGCTVTFAGAAGGGGGGWDVDKAVAGLDKRAGAKSISRCAAYVKKAIQDGGLPYIQAESAYMLNPKLENYGFEQVATNGSDYTPQKGDVVVFPAVGKHVHGHTAMYDGKQWVSDFKQKNMAVWKDQKNPKYTVFRHKSKKDGSGANGNQAHAGPK